MCDFWFSATDSAVITAASAARRVCSSVRRCRASACLARSRSRRISRLRSATAPLDARISASINAVIASAPDSSFTASNTARDASGDESPEGTPCGSRSSVRGGAFSSPPPNTSSMVSACGRWRPEPREDEGLEEARLLESRGVARGKEAAPPPRGLGLASSSSSSLSGMDGGGGEGWVTLPYWGIPAAFAASSSLLRSASHISRSRRSARFCA
mmetsp:Transcript_10377/g.44150  ORF Transcript_10377/g.44150 Transcript_10377/m.44150 type:complete len:214 (-) Transcript_10377:37-678(-)